MTNSDTTNEVLATAWSWADAFNRGDAEGCAEFYHEDATMKPEPLAERQGKASIKEFWRDLIDGGYRDVRYMDPVVEEVADGEAILSSPWAMNKARGMIVREQWTRDTSGSWKLSRDHFRILDQFDAHEDTAEIVLVHGAWMGAWCWEPLQKLLDAKGLRSHAIDLPGHGGRRGDPRPESLAEYAEAVVDELGRRKNPVVLLGHSFGGVVISQAAERCPEKVRALAYLCAFLLPNGASFLSATENVTTSHVLNNLEFNDDQTLVTIAADAIHQAVAHDVPPEALQAAAPHLVPEPTGPLGSPLSVTRERLGRIPRYYVECGADRAIPLDLQRAMHSTVRIEQTYLLDSSHSAMFSQTEELSRCLAEIARRS